MEIGSIGGMPQGMAMNGMRPQGPPPGDPDERASELSSKIMENADSDGDGLLSTEELGSSFSSDMLDALDTDGDGLLSEEELSDGISSKMQEGRDAFMSGSKPSDENKGFMETVHSLAGEEMPPPPPNRAQAAQAYSMMQEAMFAGTASNTDQLLLDSLDTAV